MEMELWNATSEYHRPSTYAARDKAIIALQALCTELLEEVSDMSPESEAFAPDCNELARIAQFLNSVQA